MNEYVDSDIDWLDGPKSSQFGNFLTHFQNLVPKFYLKSVVLATGGVG